MEETLNTAANNFKGKYSRVKLPLDIKDDDVHYFIEYLLSNIIGNLCVNYKHYELFTSPERYPKFYDFLELNKAYNTLLALPRILNIPDASLKSFYHNLISDYGLVGSSYHTDCDFKTQLYRLGNTILQKNGYYPLSGNSVITNNFKNIYIGSSVVYLLKSLHFDIIVSLKVLLDKQRQLEIDNLCDCLLKINMIMLILDIKVNDFKYD